jgi:hypothetical protein
MNIGDVDGMDKIYDKDGKPILKEGETIQKRFSGWCGNWATRKKGKIHRIMNFEGDGEFIVTDLRMLFLRKPREFPPGYWAVGRQSGGLVGDELPGGGDWQYVLARSNRAKEMGALEFLEVEISEIKRINIGKNDASIFIENKDKFELIIDKDSGEKFADIFSSQ